jgi:hypothetical protein
MCVGRTELLYALVSSMNSSLVTATSVRLWPPNTQMWQPAVKMNGYEHTDGLCTVRGTCIHCRAPVHTSTKGIEVRLTMAHTRVDEESMRGGRGVGIWYGYRISTVRCTWCASRPRPTTLRRRTETPWVPSVMQRRGGSTWEGEGGRSAPTCGPGTPCDDQREARDT